MVLSPTIASAVDLLLVVAERWMPLLFSGAMVSYVVCVVRVVCVVCVHALTHDCSVVIHIGLERHEHGSGRAVGVESILELLIVYHYPKARGLVRLFAYVLLVSGR